MNEELAREIVSKGNIDPRYETAANWLKQNGLWDKVNSEAPEYKSMSAADKAANRMYAKQNGGTFGTHDEVNKEIAQSAADKQIAEGKEANPEAFENPEKLGIFSGNTLGAGGEYSKGEQAVMELTDPRDVVKNDDLINENGNGETKRDAPPVVTDPNSAEQTIETIAEEASDNGVSDEKLDEAKKRYDASTMGIWDAYNKGLISKEAAGYFTIDAIATFAKNLGRGVGNVGAQFTGGSIDTNKDQSMWNQRKESVFAEELQGEKEGLGSASQRKAYSEEMDNTMKSLKVDREQTINNLVDKFNAKASDKNLTETERSFYSALAADLAGGDLSDGIYAAASISGGVDDVRGAIKNSIDDIADFKKKHPTLASLLGL